MVKMEVKMHIAVLTCLLLLQLFATSESRIPTIKLPSQHHENSREPYVVDEDGSFNGRPLIGILSQPGDGERWSLQSEGNSNTPVPPDYKRSYIAASYVKFVEAGGARAVPLIYNEPEESLKEKFAAINGILFPGGGSSLDEGPFYTVAEKLFNWAIEANDNGDYFPVYGVCLGFELLSVIVSQNHSIMEKFEAENNPGPLLFADDKAKSRSIFEWMPASIIDKLHNQRLAMQNHQWGLSPEKWNSNPQLKVFFDVLTTSPDLNNKTYVSTVEGRKYPILGVQWHPEKNAYEWGIGCIPHSADAIIITQSVANYFIAEARKSCHKPTSNKQEQDFLIYNWDPAYTSKDGKGTFDQAYVFN